MLTIGSLAWIGGVVSNLLNELALQVLLVHRLFLKLAEVHLGGLLLHHGVVHKKLFFSHVIWLGFRHLEFSHELVVVWLLLLFEPDIVDLAVGLVGPLYFSKGVLNHVSFFLSDSLLRWLLDCVFTFLLR